MGDEKVTVQNLEILRVDTERNLVAIKGAVPWAARRPRDYQKEAEELMRSPYFCKERLGSASALKLSREKRES